MDSSAEDKPVWSIKGVIGYSLVVAVAFFAAQVAAMIALLLIEIADDRELDVSAWAADAPSDGLLLSVATISSALVCIPLIRFLAARSESNPWSFLGFKPTNRRAVLLGVAMLVGFIVVADSLNYAIGRPIVPEFMVDVYSSAGLPLLVLALVFAAPVFEEIFFRGFILGGFLSSGMSPIFAAIVSSLAWAAIHTQYELLDLGTIFLMGLLLAATRTRTDSLVPCLVMHGVANVIAVSEASLAVRWATQAA